MSEKKNLTTKETFALAVQNHKKNNLQVAENLYNETLKTNPNYAGAHNNLGIVLNELGEYQKAISCYEKAIQIQPNYAAAHYNLGNTLNELGEHQKAMSSYEKAIQINSNHVDAHNNLGLAFYALGEYQKAISSYEKAIQINPNYAGAHNNLGLAFYALGEYQKAMSSYEKAIQINPNYAGAHNNLGIVLNELGEYQKAISCYEKVIQIQPNYVDAHYNLGNTLKELGEHQKAMSCYEKVIQIEPDNLTSHWLSMNIFPVIYKNLKEIDHYRKRFENGIKKINQLLDTQSQYTKKQLINAINSSTNFYLHYQGRDVLELQQHYAHLIERITQKIYQEFHKERKKNISSQYMKIGFVSSFFRNHTVSKLFKNWILKLDQKYFKRFVYYGDNKFDHITNEIKQHADLFFSHTDVDQLINQIFQDNLDVLIYLDIGMRPKIQILSSLRLAPIQCNTYGHPVTSGFKNIDYYFSSELMESQNSQKHYSEKLITLPGLGINYDSPNLSIIKKPNILNKSNATIFLNLQSLFKLLPQDDHIYLDILKKHSNCCFWFLHGMKNSITSIFKERISKLFQKEGYAFEKYSYFHPRCSQEEFLGLIEESDIILDSFNWSGGNTSLEAISLNKPIVTCPSGFMRGRYTYGILKILDIEETIASSKKKYIEIAVKLAGDINFRNSIVNKIKKHKNKLFNDDKPVRFLEDVIRKKLL
jgi:predicted O-linked N-acetylglucosamine transferase (SPINDLY family)